MPSFVIHLAIGKEYIKKNKIENEEEFLKGSIAPDFKNNFKEINKEKEESHFTSVIDGKQVVQINKFKNKVNTNEDFWKGYLLHILTDFYFYQKYFKEENKLAIKQQGSLYRDYECLNGKLIELYNIKPFEEVKSYLNMRNELPKYLKLDKIIKFIEEMAQIDLDQILGDNIDINT